MNFPILDISYKRSLSRCGLCELLLSRSIIFPRFIYVAVLPFCYQIILHYRDIPQLVYAFISDRHLNTHQIYRTTMDNAAVNICVQKLHTCRFLCDFVFSSLAYILRNGIAG